MKKKEKKILVLNTFDWNKIKKAEQDKALLFMYKVLADLHEDRKFGFSSDFWAQYP